MSAEVKAFNGHYLSALTPDRIYRVYPTRDEVFFIRVGGQPLVPAGTTTFSGLVGLLLQGLWKRAQVKMKERCQKLDAEHPSLHLKAHKHSFRATAADFEESRLDSPKTLGGHGPHYGRWVFKLRDKKSMTLQLESLSEMQMAYQTLGESVGSVHQLNVEWSPSKGAFVKRSS